MCQGCPSRWSCAQLQLGSCQNPSSPAPATHLSYWHCRLSVVGRSAMRERRLLLPLPWAVLVVLAECAAAVAGVLSATTSQLSTSTTPVCACARSRVAAPSQHTARMPLNMQGTTYPMTNASG